MVEDDGDGAEASGDAGGDGSGDGSARWRDPEWLAGALAWVDRELAGLGVERTGEAEQPHVRPWATVLRVPSSAGDVWFKANDQTLRHEAALVSLLATRCPETVAVPLAVDAATGWLLMTDAGRRLREVLPVERDLGRWRDVLERYARLQLAVVDDVPALLALGVPDRRLAGLPEQYDELVGRLDVEPRFREATGQVERLCADLAAYGVPDSVQHDDLHDGQVHLRGDGHVVTDWGDACVTHPFLTLAVTLDGVIAWGLDDVADSVDTAPYRDAYLAPFAERYALPADELVAAAELARRLGWACRVVNGHVAGQDDATRARLRMFLDGRP